MRLESAQKSYEGPRNRIKNSQSLQLHDRSTFVEKTPENLQPNPINSSFLQTRSGDRGIKPLRGSFPVERSVQAGIDKRDGDVTMLVRGA